MIEEKSSKPARLIIHLSQEDRFALYGLARRARTSPAMLARLGITQLLLRSREAEPLIPPSNVENAELVRDLGLKPTRKKNAAPGSSPVN